MIKPVNINPQEMKAMTTAKCPDCDADIDVPENTEKGEILSYPGWDLNLKLNK